MTLSEVLQKVYLKVDPLIKGKTGKFRFTIEINTGDGGTISDVYIEAGSRERLKDGVCM